MIRLSEKDFNKLWLTAIDESDIDKFVDKWVTSDIWKNMLDVDLLDVKERLSNIWVAAHMTIRDILDVTALSPKEFSMLFCVPQRTIESWCSGHRNPPDYFRLLVIERLNIFILR